jgi:tetratricopeptide (TPR) repeat protein
MKKKYFLPVLAFFLLWGCVSEQPVTTEKSQPKEKVTESVKEELPPWQEEMIRYQNEGNTAALLKLADEHKDELSDSQKVLYLSLLVSENRLDEAKELGEQLLNDQPDNVNVLYLNTLIADFEGRSDRAAELIGRAYSLDKTHPDVNMYFAELELRDRNYNKANEYISVVLKQEPDNFPALVGKADVLMHLGEGNDDLNEEFLSQAVKILDRVEEIAPDYVYTYVDRSRALAVLGDHTRAMEDLNKAVELEPDVEWHYLDRIVLNLKYFGHLEKALDDIASIERLNDNNLFAHIYAAGVNDDLKNYDKALSYYEKVIQARPDYPFSYEGAGKIYYMKENYAKAADCFLKAYDLIYPYEGYLLMAALAMKHQGNNKSAKDLLSDGIKTLERDTLMYEIFRYYIDSGSDFFITGMIGRETDLELRNKAYFYLGEMMLLQNSPKTAMASFSNLNDSKDFFEADIAQWHNRGVDE